MRTENEIVQEYLNNPETVSPEMESLLDNLPAPKYPDTDAMVAAELEAATKANGQQEANGQRAKASERHNAQVPTVATSTRNQLQTSQPRAPRHASCNARQAGR